MASTIRQQTVNITPVISTVAYTSGDQLGGIQTLPIGLSETLLVELENIQLTDLAAQNAAITFHFFNALPVIISTDNQPFNISAPELTSKLIISVTLPAVNYQTIALVGVGSLSLGNVNLKSSPYSPGLLYCVAVINQSATYTSTSSISIGYNVVVYDTSDSSQITNVQLAPMGPESIKGNNLVTSGSALDLTTTQTTAMLNAMTGDSGAGGLKGMVPAQAIGDGAKYLTGAGTWGVISVPASANPALSNLTAPTSINRDLTFQGTFGLSSPDHINAVTSLTASTIISADASKNVVSLATATYPDLTELSYVKGVTSAVQTQINTKAPIANPTFTGTVGGITAAMVGAPAGSGNSSGTNTGDNSANSLYTANPMTTAGDLIVGGVSGAQGRLAIGSTEKVLATDGSASYWAIEGVKTGYPAGTVVLGRTKPSGLASALNNTICGVGAGNGITSGVGNVVLGLQAGGVNNQGYGTGITTGSYNIVLGAYSGGTINVSSETITTQNYCIAIGFAALTMGNTTIAIGYNSVAGNANSIAIGNSASAGNHNYGGYSSNISIGTSSSSYDGHLSIAIGASAISRATESIAIGYNARTYGNYSVIAGAGSGGANLSGANNTVVGADSFNGAGLTTAHDNVIIGKGAGKLITVAEQNIIIGNASAAGLTSGYQNCIIGDHIAGNTNGTVAIGIKSSGSGVSGDSAVRIGFRGGASGSAVSIGDGASAGTNGTAVGTSASANNTGSVAVGYQSNAFGATNSISIGNTARTTNSTESVAIGYLSGGDPNGIGNYNTSIGSYAGGLLGSSATRNINLGRYAGYRTVSQTDTLFIDNQDRTTYAGQQTGSLMYGVFNATASSQTLQLNAKVSSGNGTTTYVLSPFESNEGNSSTSVDLDLSLGASVKVTMTGNATFTFSNPTSGGAYLIKLVQDATGTRTVTWPVAVKWSGGTAPTLTTTPTYIDIINLYYDGTNYYGSSVLNFAP